MTCLISIGLSGGGMKLHTSKLGTFLVYTLGLSMPIFKKKSPRRFLGNCSKLWVLHKKSFYVIPKVWSFFPEISAKIFS